jgi:hypothetical protein
MYAIKESNFHIKLLHELDTNEFNRLYDDCKNSIRKNLYWTQDIVTCDDRRNYMLNHYKDFIGYKARLQGRIVYGIFHNDDPERILMLCTAHKDNRIQSLRIEITMFGKNKHGLKSWVIEFYQNASELMKKMIYSLNLRSWYYLINNDSEFANKKLYAISGITRDISVIGEKTMNNNKIIITSVYGW